MPATIVVGDLHLRSGGERAAADALVEVLRGAPDSPLVLAGDGLDLAAEPVETPAEAVEHTLGTAPELCRLLAERASRGVATTFVAGNHDQAVTRPDVLRAIHDLLGLDGEHRAHVRSEPWFTSLAGGLVHVEHGHVFDPDSAPSHPLAPEHRDDVGICLLRDFIVPIDGYQFVHRNAEPPLPLLMRVFRTYGPKAPWVIGLYVWMATRTSLLSGGRFPLVDDRAEGTRRLTDYARSMEMDEETLRLLLEAHATPTRARTTDTFLRLYLDRVFATCAIVGGGSAAAGGALLGQPALAGVGARVATMGVLALAASIVIKLDRYGGRAQRMLAAGAERAAEITGARTVVLGHVHVDASGPSYQNTASFAFPAGFDGRRPFLRVQEDGTVERGLV